MFTGPLFFFYVKPPLTVCQHHRESLQESLSIYPGLEAFIPQCDEKGQYKPLQCLGTTRRCWCVDSTGQERVGTRTMPGTAQANCVQPCRYGFMPSHSALTAL
uniref:Thyroglobulin type-1 domain-containing protein n=1 Tax=Cyprinus carpio TaxID=7962 RepID=A0A8C1Y9A9_CYPCA